MGYYLRATASYTDGDGSGKTAMGTTASPVTVTAADPLLDKYDNNDDGMIDRGEAIAAIRQVTSLTRGSTSPGTEVIAVIRLYLGS